MSLGSQINCLKKVLDSAQRNWDGEDREKGRGARGDEKRGKG